jgi:putative nucleotidyltransferase with HDIG domain
MSNIGVCRSAVRTIDFHDVLECLIAMVEARDPYTSGHSSRVADVTLLITEYMGIAGDELETIHMAAHLHDIGKMAISEEILQKPGKLEPCEWDAIRRHPVVGYDILSRSHSLADIAKIVLHHHERWDGKGYPDGLSAYDIPFGSRIIALADSIDAMIYKRPYRPAFSLDECLKRLKEGIGTQYDPDIADAAIAVCFNEGVRCALNPETAKRLVWFTSLYGPASSASGAAAML